MSPAIPLLLLGVLLQQGDVEPSLSIISPRADEPLFGSVEVEVEVGGLEIVEGVEIFVDGLSVGTFTEPPYAVRVDVGQLNEPHRIDARATHADGVLSAELLSPVYSVDQEVTALLRQLYVSVRGEGGRVVALDRSRFTVLDEGVPQELVTFGRGNVRLQATMLVDSSTSMRDGRLRFALEGAREFMSGLGQEDEASVMLFSDRLVRSTRFSNEPNVVLQSLEGVRAGGGTALADHLYLAIKQLERRLGCRVILLLSDGVDSHSSLEMKDLEWLARRSRSMIYWIRTGLDAAEKLRYSAWKGPDSYRDEAQILERIVTESGGRIVPLERIEDAEEALREVLVELRDQYVLGFYPTSVRQDGSWHKTDIRISGAEYRVRARPGYLDY